MHVLILDEIDGRIVVRHSREADSGASKLWYYLNNWRNTELYKITEKMATNMAEE